MKNLTFKFNYWIRLKDINWTKKKYIFSKPVDDALVMKILESIDDASNIETSSGVIKPAWGEEM